MDPTGVKDALVSIGVNKVFELVKSAIHCEEKSKELEDLLARASVYLDDLKLKEYASPHLEAWLKDLQVAFEEAKSPVRECESSHRLDPRRLMIAYKIDECSEKIRQYLEKGHEIVGLAVLHEVKKEEPSTSTTDVVPIEEQHFVPPEDQIFGMDETLEQVLSSLLSMECNNKWVGVYGAGGAGKTLLAKRVSKKSEVRSHFDQVLWLTFGKSCQVEAKQKELAEKIKLRLSSGERISNETLERELDGKRCLLILDDVWEAGRNLDLFDVVQANGSKIFITTRNPRVLDRKGATKTHLGLLGEEDSMKLFMLHAFPNQIDQISEVQEEVKQVVWKCGGLPLVLKVIGSRMAGRPDWDYVLELLNDKQLASLDDEEQVLQRLELGYDALASHGFQQHFLYFAAYPEDDSIRFWDLFRCWKGEGLVNNTAHAISVLKTLEDYALITEEKWEWRQNLYADKFYRIHDALLALALHILDRDGPKCYFKAGQKVPACLEDACRNDFQRISLMRCEIKELQTFEKNKATTCLLLDDNKITALPSLSNFESLKVLCLRENLLESLPDSIGELRNLETLDLGWNSCLERIPDSLEMLTKLSYLDVGMCLKLQEFPVDALLKLSNLVFFDGWLSIGIWKCKRSHDPLVEHEKCLGSKNGQLDLDIMFQALTNLVVLRLDTSDLNVELPESISELSQLKELSIRGGWTKHIHGNFQMTNLEILSLNNVQNFPQDWDWSKFPKLVRLDFDLDGDDDIKVTRMKNLKFFGGPFNDLSCMTQQNFPKLEELELRKCTKLIQAHIQLASLKNLRVNECHSITNLYISDCPSLRSIDIGGLPSLSDFTLAGNFPRLHTLQLYSNKRLSSVTLGNVDDAFSQLKFLSFQSSENLEVMPHGVERLPLLQELYLRGCKKLKTLPSGDSEDSSLYPSLWYLNLEGTSISKAQLSQRLSSLKPRFE